MIDTIGNLLGTPSIALAGDPVGAATNYIFFSTINDFLRDQIDYMQWRLLTRSASVIGFTAVVILTVWIMWQGFRIVTGQSRQPMMALVGDSAKATLIVFIATTAAYSSSSVYWSLSDGMSSAIATYVTGSDTSPFQQIDGNLAQMEAAMAIIDSIDTGNVPAEQQAKDRNRWFTGIGVAGPGVVAGSMLLLNKIALALFIGFGPFFIMCLLFEPTKPLFQKWLLYGIGTVFSLAVLSVMVTIAMSMMKGIMAAFAAKYLLSLASAGSFGGGTDGINSMALQQGGVGLLLSTLIIMAPPMAAAFFQGTLGQFASYSSFGSIGSQVAAQDQQALAQGRTPGGGGGYTPPRNDHSGESTRTQTPTFALNSQTGGQPSLADNMKTQSPTGQGEYRA